MRQQKGSIVIARGNWALRWREAIREGEQLKRVKRFKVLGEVTAEHRRNKYRKAGNPGHGFSFDAATNSYLRHPAEIKAEAEKTVKPLSIPDSPDTVLTKIGEFVESVYFPKKEKTLRHAPYASAMCLWNRYLRDRIGGKVLRDFHHHHATLLWESICDANPGLCRKTVANIQMLLVNIFNMARNRGLFSGDNPAQAPIPEGLRGQGPTESYTIDEVARLLPLVVNPMYQAVVALAWGSGMRKSELQGVRWQDYKRTKVGAIIHVSQSIVEGHVNAPKTESSKDDVRIGPEICEYIDVYRKMCGNPDEGLMFAYSNGRPLNLQSWAVKSLEPTVLNRCAVCGVMQGKHRKASKQHEFVRDESLPKWKGWHAFRRGISRFIAEHAQEGMSNDTVRQAASVLRHSDSGVTLTNYIQATKQERRALEAGKLVEMDAVRGKAAQVIGAGLKRALQ